MREVNTQQMGLMPSCIWHPEIEARFVKILTSGGKTVAVVVNPNPYPLQSHILLGGERFYLDLPGESISTVVEQ